MKLISCAIALILLAGCGSGGNYRGVTPVMGDTRGTYRLSASSGTVTAPDGSASPFNSYSAGTLRLKETTYTRTVNDNGEERTGGTYVFGPSVNTILNNTEGKFTLTSDTPPHTLYGTYHVTPDFTLRLNYNRVALPDGNLVTRSETWIKESDSPWQ